MKENTFSCSGSVNLPPAVKNTQNVPALEDGLRFLRELKNARLFILCNIKRKEEVKGYSLAVLCTQNGEMFLPAFTSREELAKWPYEKSETAICSYDDLKHKVIDDPQKLSGIVINPFGKMLLLRLELIRQIDVKTEGMSFKRVEHGRNLRLYRPKQVSPGLAEEMKKFLKTHENVYKVYLLLAREPEDRKPHWLVLLDFDGEEAALFPTVARLIQPYMKPGDAFELMKATYDLLQYAASLSGPIYSKLSCVT